MTIMTTPAGETIEVVSDEDFCEVYEVNPIDLRIWAPKAPIFAALWHEGKCVSKGGRAGAQLHLNATRYGYTAAQTGMNGLLNGSVMSGAIERSINGKRTYEIKLVRLPESYVGRLQAIPTKLKVTKLPPTKAASTGDGDLVPDVDSLRKPDVFEGGVITVDPPIIVPERGPTFQEVNDILFPREPEPVPPADVAADVARELLSQVIAIITKPAPEVASAAVTDQLNRDLVDARERLGKSLEYTQKLRRELQETGDELRAVKQERDALRQRLHIAEANMDKALGDGRRFVDAEVQKALGRIMSAKPGTAKGDDDV